MSLDEDTVFGPSGSLRHLTEDDREVYRSLSDEWKSRLVETAKLCRVEGTHCLGCQPPSDQGDPRGPQMPHIPEQESEWEVEVIPGLFTNPSHGSEYGIQESWENHRSVEENKLGLISGDWNQLSDDVQNSPGNLEWELTGLLTLLRHARCDHNDSRDNHKELAQFELHNVLKSEHDPALNEEGKKQVSSNRSLLEYQVSQDMPLFTTVLCSPYTRTVQTWGEYVKDIPVLAGEPVMLCDAVGERSGSHPCDGRSSIQHVVQHFPDLKFETSEHTIDGDENYRCFGCKNTSGLLRAHRQATGQDFDKYLYRLDKAESVKKHLAESDQYESCGANWGNVQLVKPSLWREGTGRMGRRLKREIEPVLTNEYNHSRNDSSHFTNIAIMSHGGTLRVTQQAVLNHRVKPSMANSEIRVWPFRARRRGQSSTSHAQNAEFVETGMSSLAISEAD